MVERIDLTERKWIFLIASIILDFIGGLSFGMPLIGEVRGRHHTIVRERGVWRYNYKVLSQDQSHYDTNLHFLRQVQVLNICLFEGTGSHLGTSVLLSPYPNV